METIDGILATDGNHSDTVIRIAGDPPATYDHGTFAETVWKTGNYFRRLGAHREATVAIDDTVSGAIPLSILGAAYNGADVRLAPSRATDAKLLIAPGDRMEEFDLPPGGQRVAHTTPTDDPAIHSFGEGVWSENPFFPEDRIDVREATFADGSRSLSHDELLNRADDMLGRDVIGPDSEVVVRASFDDVRTVIGGLIAPLSVGASIDVPASVEGSRGDVAIAPRGVDVPEPSVLPLGSI